eukprot:IDg21444t1
MHSAFVADADADIEVCGLYVRRHFERDRERSGLPQKLYDALQVRRTYETRIGADNSLRGGANAPGAEQLFLVCSPLCHLTERHSSSQILCNHLKLLGVTDVDLVPTDVAGICCIFRKSRVGKNLSGRRVRAISSMSSE